jgi:hypothetical protein
VRYGKYLLSLLREGYRAGGGGLLGCSNEMKLLRTATFVLAASGILLTACRPNPAAEQAGIPPAIRAQLDKDYPHWRLHRVAPEALKFLKSDSSSNTTTIARGDFNGDGMEDIALLIDHQAHCLLFVAHRTDSAGNYNLLHFDEEGADYLTMSRKGDGGYDHNTGKGFVFPLDAVEVNWFEKAARAYVFKDGEYYVAQTSD